MSQYAQQWYNDTVELHTWKYPDILAAGGKCSGVPSFQPSSTNERVLASTYETGEEV